MKIKTKLSLALGFLFLLIILLITVSVRYIHALANDTQNILVANYNTIDYARHMLIALDEDMNLPGTESVFRDNLVKQQKNNTEKGEQELTQKLATDFERLLQTPGDQQLYKNLRRDLTGIMLLNMKAIQRKSAIAESTSKSATTVIALTGAICFLLAFTLLLNLPGSIANPIKELTESIKGIAAKNYSERVHFDSHSEFGDLARAFNVMAEKLEEYNNSNLARLMMEKKRIETLINNMHDPVLGLDEHLNAIFVNEEALKITGLKPNMIIGKSTKELSQNNDLIRSLIQDLALPVNPEKSDKAPIIKIYADDKESYFEKETLHISFTPTGEKNKQLIGHFIILRNVTDYKELDVAKTNFIATISHEFKTPISSIKMSLQLLEDKRIGALNEEQKNLLDSIGEDAGRLLKITGELLNLTQAESGKIQLTLNPSDPNEILQYAIDASKTQADQKQITMQINAPEHLPSVLADKEKTTWVLTNLLSNAIRYSYNNAVIYLTLSEAPEGKLIFSVRDTGLGIAPQYINKIFDRYFRIPGTQKDGTGLGLSICKEFIEAQNGSITVISEPGIGSTFTVTLNTIS